MASKYTEQDKAAAYVVLASNDGNIKRTARETGIPDGTIRSWSRKWEQDGPPMLDDLEEAAGDFIDHADRTRWKAIKVLDHKIKDAKPSELIAVIGVLTDKIDRARGLALNRVEHVHALPSAQEMAETLGVALQGVLQAARERQEEIVEANVIDVEAKELPAGS